MLPALKRPVQRGSKPAATFFNVVKSYLACGKREADDFDMLYCYNLPDLVTAAPHYAAVDQGIDPKLVSNCRNGRFERARPAPTSPEA